MNKVFEDDYLCYDITSISSYSELNEYIKYGHILTEMTKPKREILKDLNIALLGRA